MGFLGSPNVENMKVKDDFYGLTRALGYKKDREIQMKAATVLGNGRDIYLERYENKKTKADTKTLLEILDYEKEKSLLMTAIGVLGFIGESRAVLPLIAIFQEHEDNDVRKVAAKALGEFGDKQAVELLCAALRDDDMEIRSAAASALGKIGDVRAIEPLIAIFSQDEHSYVHKAASSAVGMIGKPAVEPLIALLVKPETILYENKAILSGVCDALAKIGDTRVFELLISLLNHKDIWAPGVCDALAAIGGARAVEPLIALLDNTATLPENHVFAAAALGKIKDIRAIEPLIALLNNKLAMSTASAALGMFGDTRVVERAVEPLMAIMGDNTIDDRTRDGAARSLWSMCNKNINDHNATLTTAGVAGLKRDKNIVALIQALGHHDPYVRAAAVRSLRQICDTNTIYKLIRVNDNDPFLLQFLSNPYL